MEKPGLIQDEDELNRELYFCLLEANRYYYELGQGIDSPPTYDAKNQPSDVHKRKAPREEKRPDFQWGYIDNNESDPRKSSKLFCIECKRLGQAISNWILNENYVNHGILRFVSEEHSYALDVESGAMVGYIESLDFDLILHEVNETLSKLSPQLPEINSDSNGWKKDECNILQQRFERSFPITPFELKHLWIDLRGKISFPAKVIKARTSPKKGSKITYKPKNPSNDTAEQQLDEQS